MRFPQLLVYENDGRIAAQLQELADRLEWTLRQPRRPEECLGLLARGGPCVLVLKLSADRTAELSLLDRATWLYPSAAVIVIADQALTGLAWDLGASFVMLPGEERDRLADLVVGLMGTGKAETGDA